MRIALKIDVDTLRGTLEGVPRLLALFERLDIQATFLFSLGPDNTGRALRRIFRPGFLRKVLRTSVAANYGLKTLMYGVLIPGPDIGKHGAEVMRQVRNCGHEVGIHTYDHTRWQDYVARRDERWTRTEMLRAAQAYEAIFGMRAQTHGAAGWQMNAHAFVLEDELGFRYCSDTRGTHPFLPAMGGKTFSCPQLPTTLPTLDELVGRDGITLDNAGDCLVEAGSVPAPHGHVFTLHAELEGMAYIKLFEDVLRRWRDAGHELCSTERYLEALGDPADLPVHEVVLEEIPGRSGALALQGPRVDGGEADSA